MSTKTVVIVGGGVIGLSTAYHLAQRRYGRIVLLEKGWLGEGSSSRAAGIATGLLWSEAGINARRMSLQLFCEMSRIFPDYAFHDGFGCLNLFSPELWPAREKLLPLYDRLGVPYRVLSATEINQHWPDFHPPVEFMGLHDPRGGYSEPAEYISAIARAAVEAGVEIREHQKVIGFLRNGCRVTGVETSDEKFSADAVVSTVHAWTLPLLAPLSPCLPIKHFIHQRYLSTPMNSAPAFPPVNADPFQAYLRPATGNRLLLGVETPDRIEWKVESTDFQMGKVTTPPRLRDEAVNRCQSLLPRLKEVQWEAEHVGLISFSMDGEPILGPVAAIPGLFLGLGFHSGGFAYNPVAGLLLAEWVSEGKTSIDVKAFSPDRFVGQQVDSYLATSIAQKHAVRRRH